MANIKSDEWLQQRLSYIKALKSPSAQQSMIAMLAEKDTLTPAEEKKLNVLIRAEKAQQRAIEARSKAMALLNAEKKAAERAERKARDHELYKVAGLMTLVGLVDKETGKPVVDVASLVGALAGLSELPKENPKWQEWKQKGHEILKRQ
ncbi:TPA: conjugal transfer protein TraD [Pluralibacter gergoviae]|jgi:hypothetical protein|nr:conjugal transfer protein TraD [Pluralibacter gergoviae]